VSFVLVLISGNALSLRAQCAFAQDPSFNELNCGTSGSSPSRAITQANLLLINAGIGAVTAGVSSVVRGGPFWRAFAAGAAGGGLVYLGKRTMISRRTASAGFVGRQIEAVGSSMVENASMKKPPFARLVLPLGPLRLNIKARDSVNIRLKFDLAATFVAIYAATRQHSHFDISETFRSGAPVFVQSRTATGPVWQGWHSAGIIRVLYDPDLARTYPAIQDQRTRDAISHELVHVAQYDFSFIAWTETAESALLHHIPGGAQLSTWCDLSLNAPAWQVLDGLIPYEKRPWEREALSINR
jgi:hypothetical protein